MWRCVSRGLGIPSRRSISGNSVAHRFFATQSTIINKPVEFNTDRFGYWKQAKSDYDKLKPPAMGSLGIIVYMVVNGKDWYSGDVDDQEPPIMAYSPDPELPVSDELTHYDDLRTNG